MRSFRRYLDGELLVHGFRVKICILYLGIFGNLTLHFVLLSPNFDVSTQTPYSHGRYWVFIVAFPSPQKRENEENGNEKYFKEPVIINEPL